MKDPSTKRGKFTKSRKEKITKRMRRYEALWNETFTNLRDRMVHKMRKYPKKSGKKRSNPLRRKSRKTHVNPMIKESRSLEEKKLG